MSEAEHSFEKDGRISSKLAYDPSSNKLLKLFFKESVKDDQFQKNSFFKMKSNNDKLKEEGLKQPGFKSFKKIPIVNKQQNTLNFNNLNILVEGLRSNNESKNTSFQNGVNQPNESVKETPSFMRSFECTHGFNTKGVVPQFHSLDITLNKSNEKKEFKIDQPDQSIFKNMSTSTDKPVTDVKSNKTTYHHQIKVKNAPLKNKKLVLLPEKSGSTIIQKLLRKQFNLRSKF